ncbi:uncharacterized protein LOC113561616 isoform X2 [Ooceraea biroi]|uniref:uncharacterized protein LOC113561616 isoform X2 n=1 Tax=Ooceraea biroi TaxID=2015173 RepID=UPI000F089006|nr:uncharacterized protein LOC113561616 isoform X2 [Ooceraea biroi]
MDPSLRKKLRTVNCNCPYVVYFRINDQKSFCVHSRSLSDYLLLIYDDQRTVNYIQGLITSGRINNADEDINIISQSKDNVNFESLNLSLLHLEESQTLQEAVLLEELKALPDINVNEASRSSFLKHTRTNFQFQVGNFSWVTAAVAVLVFN